MAAAPVIPEGFEIESQPAAAATIPDGFEIESTPQQASGDLTPPAPLAPPARLQGSNPLNMPLAPVPVPGALGGPKPSAGDLDPRTRYSNYLNQFQAEVAHKPAPPGKQWAPVPFEEFQQADQAAQGEADVGRQMARDAYLKIPKELRGYTPDELAQPGGFINPRTGQQSTVAGELARVPVLDAPTAGVQEMTQGVERMAEPDAAEKLRGSGRVLSGALDVATPIMVGLGVTSPFQALRWYGISEGSGYVAYHRAKDMGMSDEDAQQVSDAVTAIPLFYGFGKMGLQGLSEARAKAASDIAQHWEDIGAAREPASALDVRFAEPIPVQLKGPNGRVNAQIELHGLMNDGRPVFRVVNQQTGQNLNIGTGPAIQDWLRTRVTDPGLLSRWQTSTAEPGMPVGRPLSADIQAEVAEQAQQQKIFEGSQAPAQPSAPTETPDSSPGEPPEPTKPTPPTQSETVSPATPNPPTAAVPTTPESPDTIAIQMQQLGNGQRKIVMIPKGTTPPALGTYPPNTRQTSDAFGNIYIYRNDLETRTAIKRAAKNNTLHELLGSADMGMAAPDKSQLPPDAPVVTSHAADGTEVQSTATDEQTLPATIEATQAVTPPGGTVSIQSPEQAISERQETQPPAPTPVPTQDLASPQPIEQPPATPQPAPPRPSQTGLDQMGGDLAGAVTGNMYDMLWGKVQAGDTTEGGAPSAVLQAAKLVRDRGGLQTPEEFQVFAQEYGAIPRDKNFQQAMRDLVARYTPAPKPEPTPQETAPAQPATPVAPPPTGPAEAPQPSPDLATPQSIEQPTEKLEPQPASADPMSPPGPRWSGDRGVMPGEPAYILDQDEDGNGKAALIEVETPRGVLWEARGENGEDLGTYSFISEAAEAAEQAYPVGKPEEDLAAPQSIEQPTTQVETPTTQVAAEDLAAPGQIEPRGAAGLVDAVYQKLKAGESLGNVTELTKLAEREFGSSRTSGNWTPKDMFDAMEAGINKYLVDEGGRLLKEDPLEGLKQLKELENRITSQGTRTEEQIKKQQFSTPPRESYLAAVVADLKPTDVVLEPSAGNGGLAAWPQSIGAEVHVNEISDRRREMLKAAGFREPTAHDGEILNALLDQKVKPTVILMNPPFSAGVVKSNEGKNRNLFGFNHVDSALQRLAPGGRLVAILGGGQANAPDGGASLTAGQSGKWFQKLAKRYNVRANVRISGKEYQKYGTNFATRLIVIDKDGPTPDLASVVKGNVDTLEDAYGLLRPIAESRPAAVSARPGSQASTRPGEPRTGVAPGADHGAAGDRSPVQGSGEPSTDSQLSEEPDGVVGAPGEHGPGERSEPTPLREPETPAPELTEGGSVGGAQGGPNVPDGERPISLQGSSVEETGPLSLEQAEQESEAAKEDSDAYVAYRPSIKGPAHPGDIVETKTMATVPMPAITYKTSLPPSVLEGGRLSAVQLEAISIAGQQNDIVLPGGFRASALIGDGTGVGKGRISAGILWDNYRKGRKRLVWVSEKWDLMQDAMRDLSGIGAEDLMRGITNQGGKFVAGKDPGVVAFQKYKATADIKHDGVLFSTYSLLRSKDKQGNRRIAQLERYLRGDDDGDGAYILFDESHNLKNAIVGMGGKASQTGVAVKELLERIPKLRSVSLSATAATDVVNLGYLDRLGLWGPGTAFPNGFREFQSQVGSGGLAAMELIARELKAQGKYVSRTLSFKGVTYNEHEHKLSEDQKELYRTASKAWGSVLQSAEQTIRDTTNGGGRALAGFMSAFYGAQQRFFNILITTLKIPTAIELANKALAENKSVVITLVNTNEAAQNREKNKPRDASDDEDEDVQEYDFGPKEMLIDLVKKNYPVQQYRDDVDPNGKPIKVPVYRIDADGREIPVLNPAAVEAREALIKQINRDLHLPENPLDILINGLGGPNQVAELTGRKEYYDRATNKFVPRGDPNAARKDVNVNEQRAFMSGKKRVAVLSGAAGTGISLHASNQAKNQQRRYHMTLQVGWSADKAMQMLGRTHRTDQKYPPEYMFLVSDVAGEKRFVSTISRRLGSLGALTKGQKNATGGSDMMSKVNFETDQGRQATNAFYEALLKNVDIPGTDLTGDQILADLHILKPDPQTGRMTVPADDLFNVTKLLNRLMAMDPDVQGRVYDFYYDIFNAAVHEAIEAGTLDTGVRELPGENFDIKKSTEIAKDPKTGAKTYYYPVDAQIRNEKVDPKELNKRLKQYEGRSILLRNGEGRIYLARVAPPIVHANGLTEPASYVAWAGNGKWVKTPNAELVHDTPAVADWAAKQEKDAEKKVRETESDLNWRRESIERDQKRERERLEREAQSRIAALESRLTYVPDEAKERIRQQIAEARNQLEAAKNYELPADHYQRNSIARLEPKLAEYQKALEAAKAINADPEQWAKDRWAEQYEAAPTHTTTEHHLIGGAVMKYWNPIKDATFIRNSIYSTTDSKTGQRAVGISIPRGRISALIARIEGGRSTVSPEQIHDDVLRNGTPYTLENNIQIRRGRVGRDNVIQLVPPNPEIAENLKRLGVIYERGVVPIYYLPNERTSTGDSRAMVALTRILQEYPVKAESGQLGETARVPELSGKRDETYILGSSTRYHIGRMRFEPAPIEDADVAPHASLHVANLHGIELVGRVARRPLDDAGVNVAGFHFSPEDLPAVLRSVEDQERAFNAAGSPAMQQLKRAISDAQSAGHSLVFVKDHVSIAADERQAYLDQELNHVRQRLLGPTAEHLGPFASQFTSSPLGKKARTNLEQSQGYDFSNDAIAALEIGERLMRPGAYRELGLSEAERNTLGQQYVQSLEQAYGARSQAVAGRVRQSSDVVSGPETGRGGAEARPGTPESARDNGQAPSRRSENGQGDIGETARQRKDVTLGSGLGAVHEPLVALYQKDIVPTAKSISRRLHGALDDLKKVFAPQTRGPLARKGAGLIREMGSEIDQRRDRAVAALEGFRQHFYRDTKQEHGVYGLNVYDAIERGKTGNLSPVDRAFAQVARQLFDARKAELEELGLVKTYIENYLPHEYKNADEASRWIQSWQQKRPMAGNEAFRRQRTYPTMREALEDPDFTLEAKFDNPVDFVLSKLGQMDKSILAHMAFEELHDADLLKYVRAGQKPPAGYAPIDDRLFTVAGPRYGAVQFDIPEPDRSQFADDEEYEDALHAWEERMQAIDENISPRNVRVLGKREMGKYYAAEPLARVINNHLSPGISHSELYKAWRAVNNTLNMIDLSVSYYHGLTTTLNSSFSDMAYGLKQALHGKPIRGATSIGRGFVPFASVVHDVYLGTTIQKVWDGQYQAANPLTMAIVDALKQGGGRARQDLHYATSYTSRLLKAWNEKDNPLGSALKTGSLAPMAALEQTMKPIMEYMVPRAKLGAFAKLAQLEIEKNPDMSVDEAREVFGRIWDSIDDRFGQLSQRNLMMHGTVRDVMNATVGRPGWNIGTVRALAGGATDAIGNAADLARGRKTQVTDRTLYLLALLFGGAMLNGLVNVLLTGTAPTGKDWIMPRDGGATEDGRPSRIVLPTYVAKDLYSYFTRPLATLKGKAAPAATIASDLLTNRNFQNQKIYGRGSVGPWNYAKSAVTPYAVQGLERNIERGASPAKTALPFVGIMPAGKRAGLSKAEQIITDYQDEQRANTRPAPTDHARARSQVFTAARRGDLNQARQLGQQAVQRGVLTPQDVQHSIQRARQTPLVNDFKGLPLNVALEVYDAATPEERKQIQAIARKKVANARAKPYEWDDESRGLASRYFGIRPPTRRGDFSAPSELQ